MLGDKIKTLRKKNNMTLKDLGNKLELGESTISLYESNKRTPDYDTLKKIASVFEVPCAYLIEEGIFAKSELVELYFDEIINAMECTFGIPSKQLYDKLKPLPADAKTLFLSRRLGDIEITNMNGENTLDLRFFSEDSYDDIHNSRKAYEKITSDSKLKDDKINLNKEDIVLLNEIKNNEILVKLIKASKDVPIEDIQFVYDMLVRLKNKGKDV